MTNLTPAQFLAALRKRAAIRRAAMDLATPERAELLHLTAEQLDAEADGIAQRLHNIEARPLFAGDLG